ncbi:MAG: MATE family efflux transporter [Clostridia bacterium]|jgi:putative MATE family efflux protein|nr:MATE family efflux transporter [Clostridia bacterium]HPB16174.1 MATE family efflux transporter [Clostridia bacterium]HQM95954.1 MATE family efflux transporter [Clostridia bacterium]HQO69120.1 MATE family efflux transporter [Clostridia bacterium]
MLKSNLIVKDKSFYKTFFSLTAVLALQNLIIFSVNMADSVMLGRYSENALSGVALVNQIQFLLQMLVVGIADGALVFGSRAWGGKDMDTVKKITSISVKSAILISIILGVIVFIFPNQVLSILSDEMHVVSNGAQYISIICFTYPMFAVTTTLLIALRSVEKAKIGFYISIFTLISNVTLNYILIFGKAGFAPMGVRGAAYATLVSRAVEMLLVILYTFFYDETIKLKISDILKTDIYLMKAFLKKGLPVFLSNGIWGIAMAAQTAILGHMGQSAITANSIATTLFQILSVIAYGSANASAVIISKTIGENKIASLKQYSVTLQIIYLIIGLITGTMLFLVRKTVVSWYIISAEAEYLALGFIIILSVTVIGTSYEMAGLTGIVRGGGDTAFVLKNDFIFMWLFVIPAAVLAAFYFKASPLIVFMLLKSDQILKCIVAAVKINRYTWIKKL